ncbi:tetrapyrrole methylase [Hyaloraphidium curvatum]|nr:tetrapyrrole methylase [Hyaloraphidium curvatum]
MELPVRLRIPLASAPSASDAAPPGQTAWLPLVVVGGGDRALRTVERLLAASPGQQSPQRAPIVEVVCSARHLKSPGLASLLKGEPRLRRRLERLGDFATRIAAAFSGPSGPGRPLVFVETDYGHQFDRDEWDAEGTAGHIAVAQACLKAGLMVSVWGFPELSTFELDAGAFAAKQDTPVAAPESASVSTRDDDSSTLRSPSPGIASPPPHPHPALPLLSPAPPSSPRGTLHLVGAGPGHPSHLTLLALSALLSADAVVTDRLVSPAILSLVTRLSTRNPRIVVAGKHCGRASRAQDEIYVEVLAALEAGETVVRLKSGDPFVFGRGGEEYARFARMGFAVRVVPGLSSALAGPAAGLVPATHRGAADQLLVATGVKEDGSMPGFPEYSGRRTCVFLMAAGRLGELAGALAERGFPADEPAAVVEKATWGEHGEGDEALERLFGIVPGSGKGEWDTGFEGGQQVVRGTLETIAALARDRGITNHAVLVVGKVVDVLSGGTDESGKSA